MTTPLPKTRGQYLKALNDIKLELLSNDQPNGRGITEALCLLTMAVVELKEALEPEYKYTPEYEAADIQPSQPE